MKNFDLTNNERTTIAANLLAAANASEDAIVSIARDLYIALFDTKDMQEYIGKVDARLDTANEAGEEQASDFVWNSISECLRAAVCRVSES